VTDTIGGVELGGGWGSGHSDDAVPVSEQSGTGDGVAVGTCAPQAQSSVMATTKARRCNSEFNGREG
jgi:hypothetical protein